MDSLGITSSYLLDRGLLEAKATEEVCACLAYEIADNLDISLDQEQIDIINHNYDCDMGGLSKQ